VFRQSDFLLGQAPSTGNPAVGSAGGWAKIIPVEEGSQQLANVERAPSLAHLILVSLAGLKGTVDGTHLLILFRYARRLQVIP
jgi:hypothetical protein